MRRSDVLTIVLAGGKGTRLEPFTLDRAKPAVPFAGAYRIIDFALSNCLHSGLMRLLVLTQYKSLSLDRHLHHAWSRLFQRDLGQFLDILPPQQRVNDDWYLGTAHAVYQNIYSIENVKPRYVLILAGDHVYKMDYKQMLDFHEQHGGVATVAALPVHVAEAAGQFGVMEIDRQQRIIGFEEKPSAPRPIPGDPQTCWASMGIYVFNADMLVEELTRNDNHNSAIHDFGHHVLPRLIDGGDVYAYQFQGVGNEEDPYWRDVGTVDAYHEANMEILDPLPRLDLHNRGWMVRSLQPSLPPAKVASTGDGQSGDGRFNIFCPGAHVNGRVSQSIVGFSCRIEAGAVVENSILFDRCHIGAGAVVRNAILDKDVRVADGGEIGVDAAADERRGILRSPQGIACAARAAVIGDNEAIDRPASSESLRATAATR